jgi:hypothetical protein
VVDLLHRSPCRNVAEVDRGEHRLLEQCRDVRLRGGGVPVSGDPALAGDLAARARSLGGTAYWVCETADSLDLDFNCVSELEVARVLSPEGAAAPGHRVGRCGSRRRRSAATPRSTAPSHCSASLREPRLRAAPRRRGR